MRRIAAGVIAASILFGAQTGAHEVKGPNGGRIVDAGDYHLELVASGTIVEVYVTDSGDNPVAADAFKGLAILTDRGRSQRIGLIAAGGHKLHGQSITPVAGDPKGVVQITLPEGKTVQGQY